MASPTLHPTVLWAQRKDKIFLTIDVQDCKDPTIGIVNDDEAKCAKITFRGAAHSHATGPEEHRYALDLDLFDTVNTDDVKQVTTDRTITLVIAKKEEGPHWPRLLKQSGKTPQHVKADWDKWIDEDDEEEAMENGDGGFGGFDPSMLQQFQNMGAMNAMGGGAGAGGFDLSQLSDLAAVDDLEAEEDVEEGDEEEEKE